MLGGAFAEKFHRVEPLDEGDAFGDRTLEFDRADFAAVLFTLQAALQLLIVVERAFDAFSRTVEQVDKVPEQSFQIGF